MSGTNTTTRTYNPNVRVGNWNEEICLDEDRLKDFLDKQDSGTLLIQRTEKLMHTLLEKTQIENQSDTVEYGGNISLFNPGRKGINSDDKQLSNMPREMLSGRKSTSISINVDEWPVGGLETLVQEPLALSGAPDAEVSCIRNTFKIVGEKSQDCQGPLRYGDKFAMQSLLGQGEITKRMFLFSDRQRLGANNTANRKMGGVSPLQLTPVEIDHKIPYGAFFTVESYDPLLRMEHEGLPVPKNQVVLLKHCSTGQHVAVLDDSVNRTPFGNELSIGAKTYKNSHKAERDNNYWFFK